jgi:two-component system, chemotaxis family, protein-glutamate methylesterase/glutaminase
MAKIRVLIVDDSALMRQVLTSLLSKDPDIEVIGSASDPYIAREKIKALHPDVLTLDVEMPKMDGLTFLEKLMRGHPMPVVMVSSLTEAGCQTTLRALELGAVDFMAKPKIDLREGMEEVAQDLIIKVKAAAQARVRPLSVKREASKSGTDDVSRFTFHERRAFRRDD